MTTQYPVDPDPTGFLLYSSMLFIGIFNHVAFVLIWLLFLWGLAFITLRLHDDVLRPILAARASGQSVGSILRSLVLQGSVEPVPPAREHPQ